MGDGARDAAREGERRVRVACILTHNRPELLAQAVASIRPQVDYLLVLDNASSPAAFAEDVDTFIYSPLQPPNIAVEWNKAFDHFDNLFPNGNWDAAMLCDDTLVPEMWFDMVTHNMRVTGAAVGATSSLGRPTALKTTPDSDIMNRMPGWAWIVDGDRGLRADPSMRWWWVDTDLDFQARSHGGMVLVGGPEVANQRPGEYTNIKPELGEQAGRDRVAFIDKWGFQPW